MVSSTHSMRRFGVFGFGMYPIGLELSVENSYPVDEAAGTALIFLSGQIQGGILIAISGAMEQELVGEAQNHVVISLKIYNTLPNMSSHVPFQSCTSLDENGHRIGKDHTNFLMFIAGYITLITIIFILGLKTTYKRTAANKARDVEN